MAALVEASRRGEIDADPVVVISNVPGAAGLARAAGWGIPTETIDHREVKPRAEHERAVGDALDRHGVDLVCLAGYMRRLSPYFVARFPRRVFNIHPALLPAFPGLDVQKAALEHGVKISGCTVHVVDEQIDHGPIVAQAPVPVLEGDTPEALAARILEQEHRIYAQAVAWYFDGRLEFEGRRVRVLPARR
jgi:phosphoribosylglycinamide formyltransferase-1